MLYSKRVPNQGRVGKKLLTLRESPPARPKTATLAKSTDYRDLSVSFPATMPRGVVSIRGVWEHAEKQRKGDAVIPQEGRMEENSEEEAGEGRGGKRRRRTRKRGGRAERPEASWIPLGASWDVSWELLGGLLGRPGGLLAVPGGSWTVLGASGEPLGASWGPLGSILGASWRPLGGLLRPSWGHIGAILGPLGASWAPLGAILEKIDQRRGVP